MTTALITHDDCLAHETPPGHPERAARLKTLFRMLGRPEFAGLKRYDAPLCEAGPILRAHPQSHLDQIAEASPARGYRSLDPDTHMSPGSMTAALRAAGANVRAVDLVVSGEADNAFCAVRPPGHHAEAARAMGFCIFSNVMIGALHALAHHGLERVGIVDFDVHHGNGTSALAWNDGRIFFASTHEMPLFPGTGYEHETGAHGQIVNVPLRTLSGSPDFRKALERRILPALAGHRPQCVFVSAGFDAHLRDPLATLRLTEDDFAWATGAICDVADSQCGGRVISTLEGGYDLQGLENSAAAHLGALMARGE